MSLTIIHHQTKCVAKYVNYGMDFRAFEDLFARFDRKKLRKGKQRILFFHAMCVLDEEVNVFNWSQLCTQLKLDSSLNFFSGYLFATA